MVVLLNFFSSHVAYTFVLFLRIWAEDRRSFSFIDLLMEKFTVLPALVYTHRMEKFTY